MSTGLNNKKSTLKVENTITKQSNTGRQKADTEVKEWEFFKKVEGLGTDYLTKMLNIASTLFTPSFSLPTLEQINNVTKAVGLITGLAKKAKEISNFLDKENGDFAKRKEYVRLSVEKTAKKYNKVV